MEILNNIWVALSTENVELVNIIFIPFSVIEAMLLMLLFTTILNIKSSKKANIIYVILTPIFAFITNIFVLSPYNVFINYMCLFILIKYLYKTNILKTILAIILPAIIFALIITLLSNPILNIFNITTIQLETIPIYRFVLLSIAYIFIGLIILIIKLKKAKLLLPENLNKKTRNLFILNFVFGILIIFSQSSMLTIYLDQLPIVYSLLSFFSLIAYFALSIYSLTRVVKLDNTTQELRNAEEYNRTLQILHDNVRGFKHDYDNTVATLGGYINTNDMEGLKKYYKELETECKLVNNLYILNPKIVNNPGVYSLLTNKYKKAEDDNIKMTIEFLLDMNDLKMNIYQFSKILGILLDNAIEASKTSKEKIINVYFRNENTKNRQVIIIENSYSNKEVDLEKIFEKNVTEKEKHSGLGLYEVRKILKKNNNINLHTTKDNDLFKQQLEIYYE